jgi:DNA-binding PadR family transcriptional regulator
MLPPPLGEVDLVVLAMLNEEPRHGYALLRRLREGCSQSTMYRSLGSLRKLDFVERTIVNQEKSPNRHVYRITELGRDALLAAGSWTESLARRATNAERTRERLHWLLRFRPTG